LPRPVVETGVLRLPSIEEVIGKERPKISQQRLSLDS
jgi:hypothetical protein